MLLRAHMHQESQESVENSRCICQRKAYFSLHDFLCKLPNFPDSSGGLFLKADFVNPFVQVNCIVTSYGFQGLSH